MSNKEFIFKENMLHPPKVRVICGVGARVKIDADEYILACVAPYRVVLINIETGHRYTDVVSVEDVVCLTSAEWSSLVDNSHYEVIK